MQVNQRTLSREHVFSGVGLHTGKVCTLRLKPAVEDHGIVFCRTDMEGRPTIPGRSEFVTATARGTVLSRGEASVSTIEHLMATLYAFGVDNVLAEIDGPEVPILDGSAYNFAQSLSEDRLIVQSSRKRVFSIKSTFEVKDSASGSYIRVEPHNSLMMNVTIDFNSAVLGVQSASFDESTNFTVEVAPCRTFVFLHDIVQLLKNNLIKGGDLDNAIVIAEREMSDQDLSEIKTLFGRESSKSISGGYLNVESLKFENECARHKLLDLLGDLALSGVYIKGRITAFKPGHKINTETAKKINDMANEIINKPSIPQYDPNAEPIIDINGIKKLLPHRPPFLMVDRITHMEKEMVVGIKTIGVNEGYFIGHFPEEPVMPGVLIIEAMAQVGGILVLSDLEEPERHSTYFAKIDNAKFKRKVVPGDVLVIKLTVTAPLRRSIVSMHGEVYVGNTLACEADMVAQVIKNK